MPTSTETLLALRVPLVVQIGRCRMSVEGALSLVPGSLIELDKSADEQLDILINAQPIGRGHTVKVGENFGIRVDEIDPPAKRLKGLTSHDEA